MKCFFTTLLLLTITNVSASFSSKKQLATDTTQVVNDNILYKVTSDDNYIHLSLGTSDKDTMIILARFGITVYFDTKGKKKKDVYIKYPLENNRRNPHYNDNFTKSDKSQNMLDFNKIINSLSQEVEYGFFEDKQSFNKNLNNLGVTLDWRYSEENNLLEFNLTIPKKNISLDKNLNLSKLIIGVVSNKVEKNQSRQNNNPPKGSNSRQSKGSGMRGGGKGGGGGRGGSGSKGGNRGGEKQTRDDNARNQIKTLDFWFNAGL